MKMIPQASLLVLALSAPVWATGTWAPVNNQPASGFGTMELMSNGTVLLQTVGTTNVWYKLTPNSTGDYGNGTFTTVAPMSLQRKYYATEILKDGRMLILGGEYSGPSGTQNWSNKGEIYDPIANSWTAIANFPESQFGDVPTQILPNGNILAGSLNTANTYIYNVSANTWSATGTKLHNDRSDEESWVKAATGVLSYDVFGDTPRAAQYYNFSTGTWTDGGTSPVTLQSSGSELGAALRLPSNGKYFYIGGNSNTALDAGGTWTAGPTIPPVGSQAMGGNDAPAAVMPNGKVLLVATSTPNFAAPTVLEEYDPTTNTISAATTTGQPNLNLVTGENTRMLVLPSGQILFSTGFGGGLGLYTGTGSPSAGWKPVITNIVHNADGTFTLTGTQLNGLDEGAAYGDDAEMSTNYPIIQCTDSLGHVLYAHSYNWSLTGIATGAASETVVYTLPLGLGSSYTVRAIANGIASDPYTPPPGMFTDTIDAAPEPASLGCLSVGAIGLLLRRRKSR